MTRLVRELIRVAQSGWIVTTRLILLCLAVAAAAVAISRVGLPGFM